MVATRLPWSLQRDSSPRSRSQAGYRVTGWLTVGALSLLLLLSAIDKLFHYSGFVNAVRNYVLVPPGWADYLAPPVIVAELLLGGGLLTRRTRRIAAALSCALFLVFLVALALNFHYGERGICGCWFTITVASGPLHLVLNVVLAALAAMTWWSEAFEARAATATHRFKSTRATSSTSLETRLLSKHPTSRR